ncbi:hypothetical protein FACS189485_10510 [Spirochaetia bacterium]|nr:hypothetical protein FACS189485_10510 [Spirochaetia bacterium]
MSQILRQLREYLLKGYSVNRRFEHIERQVSNTKRRLVKKVNAVIYTPKISAQLQLDLQKYNAQYPPVAVKTFKKSHDRFLIIDDTVYHIGASLKDLGKKWFAFSKMMIHADELLRRIM